MGAHGGLAKIRQGPEYYLERTQGCGPARGREGGASYYLSSAEQGHEPSGTWVGEALAEFGIHDGDEVQKDDLMALYGEFRVPGTEDEHLGAPPRDSVQLREKYRELREQDGRTTAELSREDRRRLWNQARAEVGYDRRGVRFFDYTFAVDKTVSLAHAAALARADEAREAGDLAGAGFWQGQADVIWEEIEAGAREAMAYLQAESRYVQTGHHGRRDGVDRGRVEEAREIPCAFFRHHTSREGEPHLHIHALMLNKVQRVRDLVWQAFDARETFAAETAATAVGALRLEAGLRARAGFEWVYRPESKARVLAGTPDKAIAAFSSRREQIKAAMAPAIEAYRAMYGKEPNQRALWTMRQAVARETRKPKPERAPDGAQMLRQWDAHARRAELGSLAALAQSVWGRARPGAQRLEPLTAGQERQVLAAGLAAVQEEQNVWTRHDLLRSIADKLPDHAMPADPGHAREYLAALTSRALRGEGGEHVACQNPNWPVFPKALRRACDGQSIYRRHGGEVYSTVAHMSLEQMALRQAGKPARTVVPALNRALCAKLLGTTREILDAYIAQGCPARDARTARGLRMDQAVAAYRALTDENRFGVITGPAGTGKTFVAGVMADVWTEAGMGPVYGVALTSNARDQLRQASPHIRAYNCAQFLGHTKEEREAAPAPAIEPGALVIVDEATMPGTPDFASIIARTTAAGGRGIGSGDHRQLGAPAAGGLFGAIARQYGETQLNLAQRLLHPDERDPEWESEASLQLRAGGPGAIEALREYDDHGRLHGSTREEAHEHATRHFLREFLAGRQVILTAQSHAECAELNRRIQESLAAWGKIDPHESVALAYGAQAHPGDWILAGKNTKIKAGGRDASQMINGNMLLVEGRQGNDVTVRRQDGWDTDRHEPVWGPQFRVPQSYLARHGRLGYAITWLTAQGRDVDVGISLVSSTRWLRGLYESITRGREENHAYAHPGREDQDAHEAGGDPELARQAALEREAAAGATQAGLDTCDPVAILGPVVSRHDPQLLATETGRHLHEQADHLAYLHGVWDDLQRRTSATRFATAVQQVLPAHHADNVLRHSTDDLYRALRHAELAGKDGAEVLAAAVAAGSLDDARSVAAVLARRVRDATEHLPAAARGSWESRAFATGQGAEIDEFVREVGRAMDARQDRLGKHHAGASEVWATQALGPVPGEEQAAERAGWERAAGILGAYRERFGWDHPGDAIGPRPPTTHPERRAEWDAAQEVMPKVDGVDLRGLSDGQLFARRQAYQREVAWQPPEVAGDLRLARKAEIGARIEAARFRMDAEAAERAGEAERAASCRETSARHEAVADRAARIREALEPAHETRRRWNAITESTRRVGRAADMDLRRRERIAEDDRLAADPQAGDEPELDEASQAGRDKAGMERLGLTPGAEDRIPGAVEEAARAAREAQDEIDERLSQQVPDEDPDYEDIGPAWSAEVKRERDAVIRPPAVTVEPAEQTLERTWEYETAHPVEPEPEMEAGG